MPRLHRLSGTALALALVLALAGCGNDDSTDVSDDRAAATEEPLTLIATEFGFEPDDIAVSAGTREIVLDNSGGTLEHDFVIDELGIEIHTEPGEVAREVVTLEPGTYEFYCSIVGHHEAGMAGSLQVD